MREQLKVVRARKRDTVDISSGSVGGDLYERSLEWLPTMIGSSVGLLSSGARRRRRRSIDRSNQRAIREWKRTPERGVKSITTWPLVRVQIANGQITSGGLITKREARSGRPMIGLIRARTLGAWWPE